jgi:hypothetical protein
MMHAGRDYLTKQMAARTRTDSVPIVLSPSLYDAVARAGYDMRRFIKMPATWPIAAEPAENPR